MKRVLKILAVIAALLLLLVVGAMALLESNWARGVIAERASAALGRQVSLEGLDIDWSSPLRPRIRATGIRVANAEWAEGGDMAEVDAATVQVDLTALVSGRVVLPEVALDGPRLRLERNAEGAANWEFGDQSGQDEAGGGMPEIGRLTISGGEVGYKDPELKVDMNTRIDTVSAEGSEGGEERLKLVGSGTYNGQEASIDATVGSVLALANEQNPFPVDGEFQVGGTRTRLNGTITRPLDLAGMNLTLDVEGENLADLFPIFGFPSPATPPFTISGRLERQGTTWKFQDFDGKVGDSDLSGTVAIDLGRERPFITGDLVSERLDFDDLAGFIGASPGTGEGETASPEQEREAARADDDGRLIPNTPINLETLNAVDMELTFRGEQVDAPNLPISGLEAKVVLREGKLRLDPVSLGVAGGRIAGVVALDGSSPPPGVETDLDVRNIQLKDFFGGTRFEREVEGTLAGRVQLSGRGDNLHSLLASSDGKIGLAMGGGTMSGLIIEALGIDAAEALGMIVGEDTAVPVRCMVADLAVEDGRMRSQALVFDTTDTNVTGEAVVNLKNEAFDVELMAHPKDPSPLAGRTGVGVEGTFADPKVTVDSAGLLARGAAAVALGVLLGPITALAPMIELGLGEDSPCGALMEQARQPAK